MELEWQGLSGKTVLGGSLAERKAPALSGTVKRRATSTLFSFVFGGLVVLFAFPMARSTQHLIARYYGDRATQFCKAGDFARAVVYWKRSIDVEPANADSYYELGRTYGNLGAPQEALQAYEQAISLNRQFYSSYIAAADVNLAKRKDYEAALREIEKAILQGPQQVMVQYSLYTNLGRANIGLANWDEAQRNLRHAIQIDPTRGAAHCLIAQVLESGSQADRARSEWSLCAAMSNQLEVEESWRLTAEQRLSASLQR